MKKYTVLLPVNGRVVIDVKAINKEDAIDKALQSDWELEDVQELNAYDRLVQGNVFYGDYNKAEILEEEEE